MGTIGALVVGGTPIFWLRFMVALLGWWREDILAGMDDED